MRPVARFLFVCFLCAALLPSFARGMPEERNRYPVKMERDGRLAVINWAADMSDTLYLPPNSPDGYRFSWKESYYELVSYSGGRYAVLSLDPQQEGRSQGHTLFLLAHADPGQPLPEWVTDERSVLKDLPEYAGSVAFRAARQADDPRDSYNEQETLVESLRSLALAAISNPTDADKAAAGAMAAAMTRSLVQKTTLSTYWMKYLIRESATSATSKDTTKRRIYGLALVPRTDYAEALKRLRVAIAAGSTPSLNTTGTATMVKALAELLPGQRVAAAPDTQPRRPPVLSLQDIEFSAPYLEGGEKAELSVTIKNIGPGEARDLRLELETTATGVKFPAVMSVPVIPAATGVKVVSIPLEGGTDLQDGEASFLLRLVEPNFKVRVTGKRIVVPTVAFKAPTPQRTVSRVVVEDLPDYEQSLQGDIPAGRADRPDAVGVIIGNRSYRSPGVPPVEYAANDAELMGQYLIRSLGFREGNIIYLSDASQADFNLVFGTASDPKGKLYNYVKKNISDVFIYYSGHGAPAPDGASAYFVPVDCDPAFVRLNGYSLDVFYANLAQLPFKSLTVVIDSCFSGGFDKGMLFSGISGLTIVPKTEGAAAVATRRDVAIFTSATGNQVSTWYPEKQHSLFTYFFAKGLKDMAASSGIIRAGELQAYIAENVEYMARRLNGREQTPTFLGDASLPMLEPR